MTRTPPTALLTAASSLPRSGAASDRRVLTMLAVVSILGAAGCAGADASADSAADSSMEGPSSDASAAAPQPAAGQSAAGGQVYEDGEYTETGGYQSPAGPEEVGVTLTLESDVVTAVEVEPMPENPTTTVYQERFAGGISEAIVGKKLDDLSVDRVAGSSLTSGGFNDAADKIKSEARL
ncbi:FMN-binding protein [Arthrobacter echini]|nr:FMN-binding protein [Arthrobacter echini]